MAVCRDVEESVRQLAAGAGWEEALDLIHNQVTRINTGAVFTLRTFVLNIHIKMRTY